MALDPEFAPYPTSQQLAAAMLERAINRRNSQPVRINADLLNSPEWIRDDIGGHEEDIASMQHTLNQNRLEIPRMERESLVLERDIAVRKLQVIDLKAKLAAVENGGTR